MIMDRQFSVGLALLAAAWAFSISAGAATPADLRQEFAVAAKAANPGFTGLSAARGEQFFKTTHGKDWSCASCHGARPLTDGKHAITGKVIAPLAPAANAKRFTDPAKTEKWFKRNCNDVLGRECSAAEKGDVLEYLLTLNKG
jgi:hypothetical protein